MVTEGCFPYFLHKNPVQAWFAHCQGLFCFSRCPCAWFRVAGIARRSLLYAWLSQKQVSPHARGSSLCTSGRYLHPATPLGCEKALHDAQAQHVPSQGPVLPPSPWRTGGKSQKASTGYFPSRAKHTETTIIHRTPNLLICCPSISFGCILLFSNDFSAVIITNNDRLLRA